MTDCICGMHHLAILCSNQEKTLHFYRTLGFCLVTRLERPDRGDMILLMQGYGISLELFIDPMHPSRVTRPEALGLRHLALRVLPDRLDDIISRLRSAGYDPEPVRLDTFTGERMTFVMDPDLLPIELHE